MQFRGSRKIAAKMRRRIVFLAGCTRPNSPHFGQSPTTLADMISFLFTSTKKPWSSVVFHSDTWHSDTWHSDTWLDRAVQLGLANWQRVFVYAGRRDFTRIA